MQFVTLTHTTMEKYNFFRNADVEWQKTISIHDKNWYQLKKETVHYPIKYLQVKNTAAYIILIGKLLNTFSVESWKGQGCTTSMLPFDVDCILAVQ